MRQRWIGPLGVVDPQRRQQCTRPMQVRSVSLGISRSVDPGCATQCGEGHDTCCDQSVYGHVHHRHKTDGMFRRYHIIDHSEHFSAVAKMERVAAREEQAARAQLDRKPQSRHKTASATVATAKPESSQVQ